MVVGGRVGEWVGETGQGARSVRTRPLTRLT